METIQISQKQSLGAKIKSIIPRVLGYILVYTFLMISMLPIIGWWGGVAGLIFLISLITYVVIIKIKLVSIFSGKTGRLVRTTGLTILFGLFFHMACRVHSEKLMAEFQNECKTEKGTIYLLK